jgi:uncharacterized protein
VDIQRGVTTDALLALESNYCRPDGARLIRAPRGDAPDAMTRFVHENVRALVLNPQFSCTGAKAAMRQQSYRFALYPELGAERSAAALAGDLYSFVAEAPQIEGDFTTFIASFESPAIADEGTFERLLWRTLQQLHDIDVKEHEWAAHVSAHPADPDFSFSFGETAFFVVGLHAASSRATRRLAWPTLVFNFHDQFDALKRSGRFGRFQRVIRDAERRLQGSINPMSADFGERSEAAQYSGREVEPGWRCPFSTRNGSSTGKP